MSKALSDEEIAQSVHEIRAEADHMSNALLQKDKTNNPTLGNQNHNKGM